LCLKCARSLFQEKSSDFDRKEEFTSDFKEDRGFEDVPGIKDSRTEQNRTTHGRATGVHGRAPRAESAQNGTRAARPAVPGRTASRAPHARPCVGSRTAVRGGTAVPLVEHGRATPPVACGSACFRVFICSSLHFGGTSLQPFPEHF